MGDLSKKKSSAVSRALIGLGFIGAGLAIGLALSSALRIFPAKWEWPEKTETPAPLASIPSIRQPFVDISKSATAAVVNISTVRSEGVLGNEPHRYLRPPDGWDFFPDPYGDTNQRPRRERYLGSGVIVEPNGIIVTNDHVISRARDIKVYLKDKRSFRARILGTDPKTDLAVIKIEADRLPIIPWGDSDRLQVGEYIIAIGNPFGFSESVTMGIVSAVGRTNVGLADYENFIQTDAAINPGNSGGALLNSEGMLVGINTAIFSESGGYAGVGFAIPSNMARPVVMGLARQGRVVRGWIGVTIQDLDATLSEQFGTSDLNGALVSDVLPKSPAERAGIHRGDVILRIGDKPVTSARAFRNAVAALPVGHSTGIEVLRASRRVSLRIQIGDNPLEVSLDAPSKKRAVSERRSWASLSGIRAHDLTPEYRRRLGLEDSRTGVVVLRVQEGSRAEEAGIEVGDVILEVNRLPITDFRSFDARIRELADDQSVLLLIVRNGLTLFAALSP